MEIKYLGKTLKGTAEKITKKLKIENLDDLGGSRYLYNNKTGEISKVDISEKPLLIRNFGIKKINNKLILGGKINKKVNVFKNSISLENKLTGQILAKFKVVYPSSGNEWYKDIFIPINKEVLESQEKVEIRAVNTFLDQHQDIRNDINSGLAELELIEINFIDKNNISLDFDNMILRGLSLDISSIYGENVELNADDGNCVKNHLTKSYSKIKINGFEDGATPNDLYNFCSKYKIKMILFDVLGNVIKSFYPEKKNKNHKNLIGICYNNHFYPLKNNELHKIPKKINKEVYCENLDNKLIEIVNNGLYPSNVSLFSDKINFIDIDNIKYHSNPDYDFSNKVLNKLGLGDKMNVFINKVNISSTIEKLFIKSNVFSCFKLNILS